MAFSILTSPLFAFAWNNNLISYIDVWFCNIPWKVEKDLNIKLIPWVEKDICVQIKNNATVALSLNLEIVEWAVTNDNYKNKACKIDWWEFIKYIVKWRWNDPIEIQANAVVKKNFKMKFPFGMEWIQHWCIAYNVASVSDPNSKDMFDIVVRKANFMDVFVDNNVEIKNNIELEDITEQSLSSNKKIRSFLDENNDLILSFNLKNSSIIDEKITVTWAISDYFGYSKDFKIDEKIVYSNSKEVFQVNVWKLPEYKWIFKINFNVNYIPDFKFDTKNIKQDILAWWTISQSFSLVLIPWKILWIALAVLLLLRWLFRVWARTRTSKSKK